LGSLDEAVDLGRGGEDLLEVVEHQQETPTSQAVDDWIEERPSGDISNADHLGDGRQDQCRIGDRRQIDEPGAVLEPMQQFDGHLEPDSGFTGPARAHQRHEADVGSVEQRTDGAHLPLSPDQRRRR
jgi:hypothetical protein